MRPNKLTVHCDTSASRASDVRDWSNFWLGVAEEMVQDAELVEERLEILSDGVWKPASTEGDATTAVARVADGEVSVDSSIVYSAEVGEGSVPWDWMELSGLPWGDSRGYTIATTFWFKAPLDLVQAHPLEELLFEKVALFVEVAACSFIAVSDDIDPAGQLPLDLALRRSTRQSREYSHDVLRGYEWITYCCPPIAARLESAGLELAPIYRHKSFADGGLLLQFTERIEDFVGDQVRRARKQMEPVLPAMPTTHSPRLNPLRIAWDDGRNGPIRG